MLKKIGSYWNKSSQELLDDFGVQQEEGLSAEIGKQRLKQYGANTLKIKKSHSAWKLFFSQFNTPLMYLLLFAAILAFILYDKVEALILIGILVLSTFLSFVQERGAAKAMEKLLTLVRIKTSVIRDKGIKRIYIEKVVPGDIVLLSAGSKIPGDCYLLESKDLYVDESALTGETFYVEKALGVFPDETPLSKRSNVLFMGTYVISGTAKALVIHTGKQTEFGKISEQLQKETPKTEFELGVRSFGYFLMEVTFFLLLVIFAFNIYLQRPFLESILFALALSVGLTPQLLPAIITINLSHGARRMAKRGVIVKKLVSIENLGGMDILCSDKTGTLTKGDIVFDKGCDFQGKDNEKVRLYAYLNACFQTGYESPIDRSILKKQEEDVSSWEKVDEVPYDFIRKRLSVLLHKEHESYIITKGAFAQVISVCTHVEVESGEVEEISKSSQDLMKRFNVLSEEGYRVLGLAYKKMAVGAPLKPEDEVQMTFLGFLLFLDPIKDSAVSAIEELKKLGVSLKIITGDNHLVALQVGKLFGFSNQDLLTGSELYHINDRALPHLLNQKSIFAEIEPNQKERIILALRKNGHVVGFLGDGINDVTALHAADVSLSVDSAVDAAKEVAHIVLLKKDLAVLKEGIIAGRMTFANTLKYVFMASSANFGNMFSMAGASLFLPFLPLLPKQVLLTNLMTDFPEMTIATDCVDAEMIEKPLRWNMKFIRKFMLIFGLISSLFDYATFGLLLFFLKASEDQFRTGWFVESVISATLIVLVVRTFKPFFTSKPSKYLLMTVLLVVFGTVLLTFEPMGTVFGFTQLPLVFYPSLAGIIVLYIAAVELAKAKFLKNGLHQK